MVAYPDSNTVGAAIASASDKAIVRRLEALARQKPGLVGAAAFCRALLPVLQAAQNDIPVFTLEANTARRKFAIGLPLLAGEELPLDVKAVHALFLRVCRLVEDAPEAEPPPGVWPALPRERAQPQPPRLVDQAVAAGETNFAGPARAAAAARIRQVIERGELDLVPVWQALAAGNWQEILPLADGLQLEPDVLRMLAEFSLLPAFGVWAQAAAGHVDLDLWRQGVCPVCGSQPLLSELQGKESARRLRCGLCGASWYYPRLKCAFCQNEDYRSLGYISVDGEEEKYRLQTCDVCKGYIKVVVNFEPADLLMLAVEDLATLHLDLIASERGFIRAPVQ